jgi:outer membrane protein OmpA-like peptidoglycan-associated protein
MNPFILLLCLFCSLFIPIGAAQNLVINGGFERQTPRVAGTAYVPPTPCDFAGSHDVVNTSAQGWKTFEVQTPDLLQWDTLAGCPSFPKPHKGQRMVGLIMYHPFQDGQFSFDYHELIQGTLAKPLEKGKTYRISFWVYTNDSLGAQHLRGVYGRSTGIRPVVCGNFGFYFSDAPINKRENFMVSQLDFAVRPQVNMEPILETKGQWRKISFAYKPERSGYKYFLFGNFFSDAVTRINMDNEERMLLEEKNQTPDFWKTTKRIGYYLFDDFVITADPNASIEQALLVDKNYTMQDALLFDFGKAELRPEASTSLDQLAAVLQKNTTLRFEIGGHTDNVGDESSNQKLSESRALHVYQELIARKVAPEQLSWKGYGKTKPLMTNDTEDGRQKNRRVACRMVE